ncbi:DUF6262 family protein [Microbacterium sp. 22242]|uniref:DUF6262 family protein n=1 Tax=Microbacterium sp. 22242 TaxID=3453896 RepID=UPI003F874DFE
MPAESDDPRVRRLTEARRRDGARKQDACLAAVERLTAAGQAVTFAEVERLAGVSSWFAYNNTVVRAHIESARAQSPAVAASTPPRRTDAAGLRADLAHARDEVRRLREERDNLRQHVRRGLGSAVEERDAASVLERAEGAERQRDLLHDELREARSELARTVQDRDRLRSELDAARGAVKRMMHTPVGQSAI